VSRPSVYSYLRFSDPRQAAGHSAERQAQYAARWAAEHDLPLDESLSMRDEGLSAYHQQHVRSGALGVFLAAIDAGRIVPGSVLIIEGLDRLSRAEPLEAQAQLTRIINAGISVVTASDGRVYTREGLRSQPMDLVYSLLVMIRAHEESDTKSRRVRAALHRLCQRWAAGSYRGPVRAGKDPAWVTWDGTRFVLDPDRSEAVRQALALFRAGHGASRIVLQLAHAGLSTTGRAMAASHLYKLLRLRALMGEKEVAVGGQTYRLAGYYPALMSADEWDALQLLADDRGRRRVKGDLPHTITGLGITRCGYCGQTMSGQNLAGKPRLPDGRIRDSYRRLLCSGRSRGGEPCPVPGSCSIAPIERALLAYCSDQIRLDALRTGADPATGPAAEAARHRTRAAELTRQIDRLAEALASDDGPAPAAIMRRVRELEQQLDTEQTALDAAERTLATLNSGRMTHDIAARWAELKAGVEAQDFDTRLRARQMIADTFEALVVYHASRQPGQCDAIDLLIRARGGAPRWLRIDRVTGALIDGLDVSAPEVM